jgi:uncharacterized alpha-E superfamily protein
MLGKTAGGLLWMSRYLERSENTARLVEAGFRIALTRSSASADEWSSIMASAAARHVFEENGRPYDARNVVDFLLRDPDNPVSVLCMLAAARNNARLVRTALTREVWEAVNVCWITLKSALAAPYDAAELPSLLGLIRQQSALVRGAMHGTMLRNDIYNFIRLGTFLERADNTARILDVKYYVLLPSVSHVGKAIDNVQWETILRAVSAERAFGWLNGGEANPMAIAAFLILDPRMPRSLAFSTAKMVDNLTHLETAYADRRRSQDMAAGMLTRLRARSIQEIFDAGLHECIGTLVTENAALGRQIEEDYRFYG